MIILFLPSQAEIQQAAKSQQEENNGEYDHQDH